MQFNIYDSSGTQCYANYTNPTTGVWHHIVMGRFNGNIVIYVDGAYVDGRSCNLNVASSAYNMRIGADSGGNKFFGGSIDDVRIYNRALTSGEVSGLYAGSIQPLAGAWSVVRGNPSGVGANKYSVIKGSASALSSIQ